MDNIRITKSLLNKIAKYVEDNYREVEIDLLADNNENLESSFKTTPDWAKEIANSKSKSWKDKLNDIIIKKDMNDPEIYKRGGISKQVYSNIRNTKKSYLPTKDTAIQLCFGLKLTINEFEDLLSSIGYCLSTSNKRDLIIKACVIHKIYDLNAVNQILYENQFAHFKLNEVF